MVSFIVSLLKQTEEREAVSVPLVFCKSNSSFRNCVMSSKAWSWVVCISSFTDSTVNDRYYGYGAFGSIPVERIARNGGSMKRYDVLLICFMCFLELGDRLLELLHSICHSGNTITWFSETGFRSGVEGTRSCCRPSTAAVSGEPRSAPPLHPTLQLTPSRQATLLNGTQSL